jgi:glutamyl-tRNA reductase
VAAGLDSLVIGETQILSQVREASRLSLERGLSSEVLSKLFSKAYETARSVRENNPKFSNGLNNSVSHAVLDLITKRFNDRKPNLMLIGSGKMIRLAVGAIQREHIGKVVVAARKTSHESLKADSIIGINQLTRVIQDTHIDAIITATSSDDYVLREEHLTNIKRPILILDISVPRNVDPRVKDIEGITLLNLDDLKGKLESTAHNPQTLAVRKELARGVQEFLSWLADFEEIAPLLSSLRKKAEAIREEELQNAFSRLPNLTPNQRLIIEKMSERLIRRFLHDPTIRLKQLSRMEGNEKAKVYAEVISELFSAESSRASS